jgi:hypothetical protein
VNNRAIPELNNPEAVMLNSIASLWKTTPCSGPFWPTCSKSRVSKVVECASAEAAEFVLVSTGTELRALVTDVNLAGDMSGVELAQYAKRKFPRLNVVMVSGKGPPSFRRTPAS